MTRARMTPPRSSPTAQQIAPCDARSERAIYALRRTCLDMPAHWFLVDTETVTLTAQQEGESPMAQIVLPRTVFDRMVAFYQRPQRLPPG